MTEAIRNPEPTDGPRFVRVDPDRQREAIGLLLSGRASGREAAVQPFLDYARQQSLVLDDLWVAVEGETLQAAVLIVPCRGRSGMLFCSPATSWPSEQLAVELLRTACRAQSTDRMRLIQCLLDPPQRRLAGAMRDAGFHDLATLKYMSRRLNRRPRPRSLAGRLPGYRVLHWDDGPVDDFARPILDSYEQTLDCPGLRGLRSIDDVIVGHQSAGVFRPDLWHAIYDDQTPVGAMLINDLPHMDACELVYLGLAVPYRGQGLGKQLLEHALDLVHAAGRGSMILAVDERNEPATRLYRGAGFRETASKRAMVYAFGQPIETSPDEVSRDADGRRP
ncbi:GNAT family N-acetyltransferase [Phycisphaerales bacterium AB-hyl4]|uniref:GNAT family N-acetyltransferase n=1 Tax=Natronomicrosphaera hydrolytica TaxID=3242702 RepID=A0ABV4U571_9BACT